MSVEQRPECWDYGNFGTLIRVKYGKALQKERRIENGSYPVVGSAGINSFTDSPLAEGDVIVIGRKGNVGDIQLFLHGVWPIDTVYYFEVPKIFNSMFLYLQLTSLELKRLDSSTATPSLRREDLESIELVVPTPLEQEKIVEILEEQLSRLDAVVANMRVVRTKAEQFRRSLLHAAFSGRLADSKTEEGGLPSGWRQCRLSTCLQKLESGKLVERGWSPQCLNHPRAAIESWAVLKTTAIQMGEYQPLHNKELPESLDPKVGLEVKQGDFLLTTTGPRNRCGIICYVAKTPPKLIFSGKVLRFRTNEDSALPQWLLFLLMSPEYQQTFNKLKVGTSDSSVSVGNQQVLDLEIPVAPIDVQEKIIEILEKQFLRLDAVLKVADAVETKANSLRRSLLHAAFAGELTKEWRDTANV